MYNLECVFDVFKSKVFVKAYGVKAGVIVLVFGMFGDECGGGKSYP